MSNPAPPARPRRFAKACDACHKSKIRCLLPSEQGVIACSDCVRRDVKCTFTRAERDLEKPRRTVLIVTSLQHQEIRSRIYDQRELTLNSARQLEAVTSRLQRVEALLAEEQKRSTSRDEAVVEPQVDTTAPTSSSTTRTETNANSQSQPETIQYLVVEEQQELIEIYFDRLNHVFPIFDSTQFLTRLLNPSKAQAEPEANLIETGKDAILALTDRMRALSEPGHNHRETTTKFLETAMENTIPLIIGEPSILSIQVLLTLSINMLAPSHTVAQAASFLAIAVRHAHLLNLHILNAVDGVSAGDRLARIRLFWCLYIADMDLSLRTGKPPLVVDEDTFVLEPKEFSDDGLGLVVSEDSKYVLNLFTARQRLARVQRQAHTRLNTFMAQHAPTAERERNVLDASAALEEWRMAWFAGDGVLISEELWPRWTLVHIVRLHFGYFSTLLAANPCVPSSVDLVSSLLSQLQDNNLSASAVFGKPSVRLIEAARTTFKAARIIRRGGLAWLMECLRFTVSATLVLLQGVITNPEAAMARLDLGRVDTWIEVFEHLSNQSSDEYMGARTEVAAQLRSHAAKALGVD